MFYFHFSKGQMFLLLPHALLHMTAMNTVLIIQRMAAGAVATYEYCTAGEQHIIHGLIRRLIDPEGNVTEYVYNADGTVKQEWKYAAGQSKQDGGCTSYEYNDMFLISKTTSPGGNVTELKPVNIVFTQATP